MASVKSTFISELFGMPSVSFTWQGVVLVLWSVGSVWVLFFFTVLDCILHFLITEAFSASYILFSIEIIQYSVYYFKEKKLIAVSWSLPFCFVTTMPWRTVVATHYKVTRSISVQGTEACKNFHQYRSCYPSNHRHPYKAIMNTLTHDQP